MGNCHGCAASAADPSDAAVQAEQGGVPKKQPQSAATSATADEQQPPHEHAADATPAEAPGLSSAGTTASPNDFTSLPVPQQQQQQVDLEQEKTLGVRLEAAEDEVADFTSVAVAQPGRD